MIFEEVHYSHKTEMLNTGEKIYRLKKKTKKKPTKKQTKKTHTKLSQTRHRIFPVPLPKHFVKVPSLLHYVLKLLRTIALQSQLTKK